MKIRCELLLRSRKFDICLQGELRWPTGNPREVDAGVRMGDRLLLIECFTYELPLDYEVGKPSVFEKRKAFILNKLDQAQTLAERVAKEPKGSNFDVSWAKTVDWMGSVTFRRVRMASRRASFRRSRLTANSSSGRANGQSDGRCYARNGPFVDISKRCEIFSSKAFGTKPWSHTAE